MWCELNKTWLPRIECGSSECTVAPKSKYVPIRKNQRADPDIIRKKVETVISYWNSGNLAFNQEGFVLDFEEIADDFKTRKIGLPGHRQEGF